jgi:hypothetical protein
MTKTQAGLLRLSMQTGIMLAEANMVIAMRMWGMAGAWNVTPGENKLMLDEKGTAILASGMAATAAMMQGKSPVDVALAALKPVARKTRANAARLGRRGVKTPG